MLFGDGVCARIKEELLKNFNLHTIIRLPEGVFSPYTDIPTNLVFFDRSGPTSEIWYYQIPLPEERRKYTKTRAMEYAEFSDCLKWWKKREQNEYAWKVGAMDLIQRDEQGRVVTCNLDSKNPYSIEAKDHRLPTEIIDTVVEKEHDLLDLLAEIRTALAEGIR